MTPHEPAPPQPPRPTDGAGDDPMDEQLRKLLSRPDVVRSDTVDWASVWRDHIQTTSGIRTPADSSNPLSPNPPGPDSDDEASDPDFDSLLALGGHRPPKRPPVPDPPAGPTISEQILAELRAIRESVESLQPRYFSTAQMARRLGVTVGTVRRMIRRQQIRTVRFGEDGRRQQHRIPRSEVERLLAEGVITGLDTLAAEYEEGSGFMAEFGA